MTDLLKLEIGKTYSIRVQLSPKEPVLGYKATIIDISEHHVLIKDKFGEKIGFEKSCIKTWKEE